MAQATDTVIAGEGGRRSSGWRRWAARESIEDYSLRYAPTSFRTWTPLMVSSTALGGIAYLADYAIGASIVLANGTPSGLIGILIAAVTIFVTGIPISYYSARYGIDMDLLTRGAGFGYFGSTLTSLIYATFTFIFFALEGAIMAQALEFGLGIPLPVGYLITSLMVIPIVIYGMRALSKLQAWTQPFWLLIFALPLIALAVQQPEVYGEFLAYAGPDGTSEVHLLGVGLAAGVALSLIAQIGEQVDYLRFMPPLTRANRFQWWAAVLSAGPGWVILGAIKQISGALLAVWILDEVGLVAAVEPIEQFTHGLGLVLPGWAVVPVAVVFVIVSQIKINVTNAYAGSLAWSNFFSRVLHAHPGRVVWIFLNVGIALLLMELGVFAVLNTVLGFYSNVAIAWIGAVVADLLINKPILKLSPSYIEFKRAHLRSINPVGFGSMVIASTISILAFFGAFGSLLAAFSPFLALVIAFVLSPVICILTRGKYYLARTDELQPPLQDADGTLSTELMTCAACGSDYERPDMAACPFHKGAVCSLCCTLETACGEACKPAGTAADLPMPTVRT
jgi:purine-cytosine permease-like protein